MLTIIDRYIARLFLVYFFVGLAVFTTVYITVDFMSNFVNVDVSGSTILRYYAYWTPGILYQMVPVGCLMATLFTLSSLNRNSELTALFSIGVSLARVSLPILTLITGVCVVSFWLSDTVLPGANQKKNFTYYVEIKKKPGMYSTVKTNRIWYRSQNVLFNIQTLKSQESRAQGLTMYYFDGAWDLVQVIKAKNVEIKDREWILSDGVVTLFVPESSFPLTQSFSAKTVLMSDDVSDLTAAANSSDVQSLAQLSAFIKRNKEAGLDTIRYEVDYYAKFGFAFAGLVMSLLGIPFSVGRQRSGGNMANIGIVIGLAVSYWILYSSSITLGRHEILPPVMAALGPNFIMAGAAGFFFYRLKK
ncbi:MAG: LPS export ABC transporter permease LptG [Pseudobdellovibrionaceae bacterium]|nr:LPS export ABC transporter permease LptG [Bdellovibrionales bacterium]USN46187.1 MAG: LPS export ABC transporter permease LptG [Pseudobdellovibrionaceae bacterium]